jgi:type VI secretion system protein ImpF
VGRDLENLLNTKNYVSSLCSEYQELNSSLFVYGLPDFTSTNPKSPSVRLKLRQELEKAIAQFEPRLRNVTVRVEEHGTGERNLRFKINALLYMDPVAEPVTFDTFFDVNRCEYSIPK